MIKTPLEKGDHVLISRPNNAPDNLTDPYEGSEVEFTVRSAGLNRRTHLPQNAFRFPALIINGVRWETTEHGWYWTKCFIHKMDVYRRYEKYNPQSGKAETFYMVDFLNKHEKIKVQSLRKALAYAVLIGEDIIQNLYLHMIEESARQKPFRPKVRVKTEISRFSKIDI